MTTVLRGGDNFDSAAIAASKLTGALPAISGSALSGVGKAIGYKFSNPNVSWRHSGAVTNENTPLGINYTPSLTSSRIVVKLSGQRWDDQCIHSEDRLVVTGGKVWTSSYNYFGYSASSSRDMGHINRVYEFTQSTGSTFNAQHQVISHTLLVAGGASVYIYNANQSIEVFEYAL
jgi:hypothetical protein